MPDAFHPKIFVSGAELLDQFGYPRLFADKLTLELAPHFSTFEATFHYGEFSRGGAFLVHPALDLRGKTIDVKWGEVTLFSGIVQRQADIPSGTRKRSEGDIRTGTVKIAAFSLDYLLDRIYVDKTVFSAFETSKIFAFNETPDGFGYNRKGGGTVNVFELRQYSASTSQTCSPWYAYNVLDYLFTNFSASTGYTFSLAADGDLGGLLSMMPQFSPAGMTVREAICEVLHPSRGYTWYARRGTAPMTIEIVVVSLSDTAIAPEIVANGRTFALSSAIEFDQRADNVAINAVEDSAYHQIRVVGAPIRVMATLSLDTAFSHGWTISQQNQYNSLGDAGAINPAYESVYRTYYIKDGWTQTDYKNQPLNPTLNEYNGNITWSARATGSALFEFDRDLPIYTYSDEIANVEFKKPLLWGSLDGVNLISLPKSIVSMPVTFQTADNKAGIVLNSTYNHLCAKTLFTGSSEYLAIYDPKFLYLTLSWRSDALLACRINAVPQLEGEPLKIKTINVPRAQRWVCPYPVMMTPGTLTTPGTVAVPNRDDFPLLQKIARQAKIWYGKRRNTVSYDWRDVEISARIGQMMTSVYSSGAFVPVGTVVTKQVYDYVQQVVSISTDFVDIDFSRMASGSVMARDRLVEYGLRDMAEKIRNMPLNQAAPVDQAFRGPFQLIYDYIDGAQKIRVINGLIPTSAYCGSNDVTGNVEKVTLPAQVGPVYFVLKHNGTSYSHEITYTLPTSGNYKYEVLGNVANVGGIYKPTQLWKDGNIVFRGKYFI